METVIVKSLIILILVGVSIFFIYSIGILYWCKFHKTEQIKEIEKKMHEIKRCRALHIDSYAGGTITPPQSIWRECGNINTDLTCSINNNKLCNECCSVKKGWFGFVTYSICENRRYNDEGSILLQKYENLRRQLMIEIKQNYGYIFWKVMFNVVDKGL